MSLYLGCLSPLLFTAGAQQVMAEQCPLDIEPVLASDKVLRRSETLEQKQCSTEMSQL